MSDCDTLEGLLNRLNSRLDNPQNSDCCQDLYKKYAKLAFDQRVTRDQVLASAGKILVILKRLDAIDRQLKSIKNNPDTARIARLEKVVDSILRSATSLQTKLKKLDNDFRYLVKRFSQENEKRDKKFTSLDVKNRQQDNKIKTIDEQLTVIKLAIAGLVRAGGALAVLTARLVALVTRQTALETALDNLKRLTQSKQGQKGEKGDRGEKGDKGDKGDRGQKGDKGDNGKDGANGQRGQQGLKGDKGDKGDRGQKGDKGDNGKDGANGQRGQQGLKGDKGEKGDEGQVKVVQTVKVVEKPVIIETTKVVERLARVEIPKLVYKEPDFRQVLSKILELRQRLIFSSSVEIPTSCDESQIRSTTDLPSFLNAIEDKLTAIEDFICDKADLESYALGSFTEPATLTLQPSTKFVKISVTGFPDGISKRFGRAEGQPNNYPFGFIAFESDLGLAPEINWEWIDSYFYPEKENNPNKVHIYTNYPNTSFTVTGFKVKQS